MHLSLLFLLLFQQGTDQLSQTTFTMGRSGLILAPEKQAILLADEGLPVEFELTYESAFQPGMRLRGSLVGPGLSTPHAVDVPAESGRISLPRSLFTQEGAYRLLNVRLTAGDQTIAFAQPDAAEIQVAENFLVSEVLVKPLSEQDLIDRGYLFSQDDYFSVEFELALTIGSTEEHVKVPVAYPKKHTESFEPVVLEDPFKPYVRMLAFKHPGDSGMLPGYLDDPPATQNYVPGLILIPGNFNYLRSHFEVTCLVLNAAPEGFDVRVEQLESRLRLPDPTIYGTPLSIRESVVKEMAFLGEDDTKGTPDDRSHILPGEQAQSDYVVIGNIPGMYDVEIEVQGLLRLPQSSTDVTTISQGQVFVRSPEFSVDFEHPDAVAEDETYDLVMTVTNRGEIPLEGFSITLDPDGLIGVELNGSHPVQDLGSVAVGASGTVSWSLRSLISGRVISNYFKVDGDVPGALHLNTGVGETGQHHSPFVLYFPDVFYDQFPADLAQSLRRFSKTALDFSQMTPDELPDGIPAVTPTAVREFNELMTAIAQSGAFGSNDRQQMARLFQLWVRGVNEYQPLDAVRRRMIGLGVVDLEGEFGAAFTAAFSGVDSDDILELIAQENEKTPNLFAAIVETSAAAELTLTVGDRVNSGAGRQIPHASTLPLGANRHLVWVSGATQTPLVEIRPTDPNSNPSLNVTAVFPNRDDSDLYLAQSTGQIGGWSRFTFDPTATRLTLSADTGVPQHVQGRVIAPKPFELLNARQADPKILDGADTYGRDFVFSFSKALDLSSLDPIEEHIFVNGEAAVDAKLQRDNRTLIVSSRMPLGPYHPISYEIRNPVSSDEQNLGVLSGTLQGSSWYTGVSITGRIADRNGSDLREAVVFHWRDTPDGWLIFDKTKLDADNRYLFEFSPYLPYLEEKQTLKIGVLLSDGRYEEREFYPRGVGQELVADFAFLQQGTVRGTVRDDDGNPVPLATVFAVNQDNELSAVLTTADEQGVYRAEGLEVGQILVKSSYNAIVGYASGYLTQTNSPLTVDVTINNPTASVEGRITVARPEGSSPREGAFVAFLLQNGLSGTLTVGTRKFPYTVITQTDEDGRFTLEDVPVGNGFFWVFDGRYDYFERLITLADGEARVENHEYDGIPVPTGSISGHVRLANGTAVEGARVFGEGQVVDTAADGSFLLQHLSQNRIHNIQASHPVLGIGNAGISLDSDRVENVEIIIQAPINVSGRYVDADGEGVAYAFIYNPPYPFVFRPLAQTDAEGYWSATLPEPGTYAITTMDTPDIAAITELTVTDAGVSNILLQHRPKADLRIRLVDENGRPIVAKVDLKSTMPSPFTLNLGVPALRQTHVDHFTDTNGELIFRNLNIGDFEVFGHSGQFGETETVTGVLTEADPDAEPHTITLVFPDTLDPANLFGRVFDIDGTSGAPEGTIVQVKGPGVDASATVDAAGDYRFDSLVQTPDPVRLNVIASHPDLGVFDTAWFDLHQDLNFRYDLTLKRKGAASVSVINGDGTPVDFALVRISYRDVTYVPPVGGDLFGLFREVPITEEAQITPDNQILSFSDIPQGVFTLRANTGNGLVAMRSFVIPVEDRQLDVVLKLEAASSIAGTFLDHDSLPIAEAEIQLLERNALLQQRLTGSDAGEEGRFLFDELPMRDYRLYGVNPADAFEAHLNVTTSPYRPNPDVQLILDPVGHLEGLVLFNGQPVPNAYVEIEGGGSKIITGSDATGRYRFRNLPLGSYAVKAESPAVIGKVNTGVTITEAFVVNEFNLNFGATRTVELYVAASDGSHAAGVLVTAENLNYRQVVGNSAYTDENGIAILTDLPVGTYRATSEHPTEVVHLNGRFTITEADPDPVQRETAFDGYGEIFGLVSDTAGLPLEQPVHITFEYIVNATRLNTTITTDTTGFYRIGRIPVDTSIRVTAYNQTTREVANRTITLDFHGEAREENLTFKTSTYASGIVTFSDGTPAAGAEVWIDEPYRVKVNTDESGFFYLQPVLEGESILYAKELAGARRVAFNLNVEVVAGLPVPANDLTLALGGVADVTGLVTYSNGDLLRTGSVTLEIPDLDTDYTAIIQGDGTYYFTQVPLGDYRLTAHDRKFDKDSAVIDAVGVSDGETVNAPIVFEPSYQLTGRLFAANGVDPSPGGLVELWRPRQDNPTQFDLIYADQSDENGYFLIDHIYPGDYRIQAEDAAQEGSYQAAHLMRTEDMNRDIYLQSRSWLLGTIYDADTDPYTSGTIIFSQNGRSLSTRIEVDGSFRFDDVAPGPYALTYQVAGGWLEGQTTGSLLSGANTLPLTTEAAATIEGTAILIRDPAARPQVSFRSDRTYRSAKLDADGVFVLPEVPEGLAFEMILNYGSIRRVIPIAAGAAGNLGTFYLDSTPPVINYAGGVLDSLPHQLDVAVSETDPQSQWVSARVWINDHEITDLFTLNAGGVSALLNTLPNGFVLGDNTLRVSAANRDGAVGEQEYNLNVALNGVSLIVDLTRSGAGTSGQVRLNDGDWILSDGAGRVVYDNVTPGVYTLKARNSSGGFRTNLTVTDAVNQQTTLTLADVGSYTGRILDADGQPLVGAVVRVGDQQEVTDAAGNYIFDLLPLGSHELLVQTQGFLAWRQADALTANGQVITGMDLQLQGSGLVEGVVYDDDGVTVIANAQVVLDHLDLPESLSLEAQADENGAFSFSGVTLGGFRLSATAPDGRGGLAESAVLSHGDVISQDILLSPSGNLAAIVVDVDGQPVADLAITADGVGFDFNVTTQADGSFTLANMPFGDYLLSAELAAEFQYLNTTLTIDQDNVDAGTLQLTLDTPPLINAFTLPDPYDLASGATVQLDLSDDRQVSSYRITYSGAYDYSFSRSIRRQTYAASISPLLPATADLGALNWSLEVYDQLGQQTLTSGITNLVYLSSGPTLTITQPANGASFVEGQPFDIHVDAADPSGIESVSAELNGIDVGEDLQWPYRLTTAAPGVTETQTVPLVVTAVNRRGMQAAVTYDLLVNPVDSVGGPDVTLLAPLPGMPLPLSLASGLNLRFAAHAVDEDGLESAVIRVAGEEVMTVPLSGTDVTIDESWLLPESLRGASDLLVEMIVRDQGGNPTVRIARVENLPLTGDELHADAASPLELPDFDTSHRDKTIILDGGAHLIDGEHRFNHLVLVNGASLSQTATGSSDQNPASTSLTLTGAMIIDYGAAIDTTGTGYNGMPPGFGYPGFFPSHGGLGPNVSDFRLIYGSPFEPTMAGSGSGGGAVKLDADAFWLSGSISADGRSGRTSSGGSVWLIGNRFEGHGRISANGYSGEFRSSNYYGGGGGRVAVYGPYQGTAQAFGGLRAGAGTVYYRTPDETAARGFRDRIEVVNHPQANEINSTAIPTLGGLVAGTDFSSEIRTIDNVTRQILTFIEVLPQDRFIGMTAYRAGDFDNAGRIAQQTETTLRSEPEQTFSTFVDGDELRVNYRVDELVVGTNARFDLLDVQPLQPVRVTDSATLILGEEEMAFADGGLVLESGAVLIGQARLGDFNLQTTLNLNGAILADSIVIDADAILQAPLEEEDAGILLDAPSITVAGTIAATANPGSFNPANRYSSSHGGYGGAIGYDSRSTYGSLYLPTQNGRVREAGGAIHLRFQDLTLDGLIDVSGERSGSGGSILLEGTEAGATLIGAGGLDADGAGDNNNYATGGGGRIAVLVDDISGFSGQVTAVGGLYPATPNTALHQAGAGTVYYQTSLWPEGRLVLDNGGKPSRPGSTELPGLGYLTATQAMSGDTISGAGFPALGGLTHMSVAFPGGETRRILGHDETSITLDGDMPALAIDDVYHGLHRFNVLEIRGGAHLATIDAVEVIDQLVLDGGSIQSGDLSLNGPLPLLADGSFEFVTDPGLSGDLELDNFQLTVHFPLDLDSLTLRNGARLEIIGTDTTRVADLQVIDGSMVMEGRLEAGIVNIEDNLTLNGVLIADSLTVGGAGTLATPNIADAGMVVEATSMDVAGRIVAQGNQISTNPSNLYYRNYGGIGGLIELDETYTYGSLYYPETGGAGTNAGGSVVLRFTDLNLSGEIDVDGVDRGSGGAILLEGDTLTGAGAMHAHGADGTYTGGGGRIALLVESLSGFTGSAQAFGGIFSNTHPTYNAGAGTVFYRNSQYPNGRLVIDNNGTITQAGSTRLPGLGMRTTPVDTGDGTALAGFEFPDFSGLRGMYVTVADSEVEVTGNTLVEVATATPLPAMPAGTAYTGLHIFDVLEIHGGANLKSPDAIRVIDEVIQGNGSIDSPDLQIPVDGILENGSAEYFEDPGFTSLELDNFQLTVHFPLDLSRLTLNNGASLTSDALIQSDTVTINDGELVLNGTLTADSLTLSENGVIRTPIDQLEAGLFLDISGDLRILGQVRANRNPSSVNPDDIYRGSHGGYSGGLDFADINTFGSFYRPVTNGEGSRGGGRIHLRFDNLELGGSLNADGLSAAFSAGGSILLEGNRLYGEGGLSADGGNDYRGGGGGRIAVLVTDIVGFNGEAHAYGGFFNQGFPVQNGGAGTIFYRTADWPNGKLVLDNDNRPTLFGSTPLPGLGNRVAEGADGGTGLAGEFPLIESLNGMSVLFENGDTVVIAAQSQTELTPEGVFPDLSAGESYRGIHILDELEIRGEAHLQTNDVVRVLGRLTVEGGSIDSPLLETPAGFQFSDGAVDLFQDPGISELTLDNFQLTTHFDLNTDRITLNNGAVLTSNSNVTAADVEINNGVMALDATLRAERLTIAVDGILQTPADLIDAVLIVEADDVNVAGVIQALNNQTDYNPGRVFDYSHGGFGAVADYTNFRTFGSLYQPSQPGRGSNTSRGPGGVIRMSFQTMSLTGSINADGRDNNAGGSILLRGTSLTGTGSVTADGGNNYYAGGGGRIALLVNDLSGFSGATTAFGGLFSNGSVPDRNGGAGTVFFRTDDLPNGRLLLDNNGLESRPGSTQLPGLGLRTVAAATGGAQISGSDFPELADLTGLQVRFADDSLVEIDSHTQTELTPVGVFPDLAEGDSYTGLHLLDELIVRGKANLKTPDMLRVQTLITTDGSVDSPGLEIPAGFAFANGALELFQDPGLTALVLDNFDLVVHFPLDLTTLTLTGGATLTSDSEIRATTVDVVDGAIVLNGSLIADSMTLAETGIVQTPDHVADAAMLLDVDTLVVAGVIRAQNSGSAYNPDRIFDYSHGGFGAVADYADFSTFGSLYQPKHPGRGPNLGIGSGGVVQLQFQSLDLTGSIIVDGTGNNAGGSVLLEGSVLTGAGSVSANGGDNYYAGGGGRIAVIVNDVDGYSGSATAFGGRFSNGTSINRNAGAGTVFYRTNQWPNGRLVLDNNGLISRSGSSRLPGLGQRTVVDATGGEVISGDGFPDLGGLIGMHVLFADESSVPILDHSTIELIPNGVFPSLNAGDSYAGLHIFDVLEVKGNANLTTVDGIRVLERFVLEDGSIDSPELDIPSDGTLSNGSIELFEDPGYAFFDLDNFHLIAHYPIDVERVTLVNGSTLTTDSHVTANQINVVDGTLTMNGAMTADRLVVDVNGVLRTPANTFDAGLTLNVPEIVIAGLVRAQTNGAAYNPDNRYRYNHGGYAGSGTDFAESETFGSLYRPVTAGRGDNAAYIGGGVIQMNFTTLEHSGVIDVNGSAGASAGSILLQGSSLYGNGAVNADGVGGWPVSGAGGRVALLVDEMSEFGGAVTAFGGAYSNGSVFNRNGGAGTVFYRSSVWPNGKLVLDNNGTQTLVGSTELPGLGERVEYEPSGEPVIYGSNFPEFNALQGLYLRVGEEVFPIRSNTQNEIQLDAEYIEMVEGQTYSAVHVFDVLEVRGGANLQTQDGIVVLQEFAFDGGSVNASDLTLPHGDFENGAITMLVNPGQRELYLSNFQMNLPIGLELDSIDLVEGASLELATELNAGSIFVDGTSAITSRSTGNRDNPDNLYRSGHGGLAGGAYEFDSIDTYGNLYRPQTHGRGQNTAAGSGGAIHLIFNSMTLDGSLDVDGANGLSAGSILLEGFALTGSGSISANGFGAWPVSSGGGRIALLVDDSSEFEGAVTAYGGRYSNGSIHNRNGGAGTVYYRTEAWPNGKLVLDNNGTATLPGSTRLPGIGVQEVLEYEEPVLFAENLPDFNALAGMYLDFDNGDQVLVASNTRTELTVADDEIIFEDGVGYTGLHLLDVLEVRGNANLSTTDKITVTQSFVLDGGSVEAEVLTLPEGSSLANGSATMYVDPGLRDLQLDNFELTVRTNFDLDSLSVTNGSSIDIDAPLTANHIVVDATSTIQSRSRGNRFNPDNLYRASHGGLAGAGVDLEDLDTFGSLYRPQTHGRGENAEAGAGGAIELSFDTMILEGGLNVNGANQLAAGSILLQGNSLTGAGSITANGGGAWPTSSGGGRIALLIGDVSGFTGPVTAFGGRYSNGSILNRNGGAGTVFYRTSQWPNGRLVLDNDGTQTLPGSTRLPGIGARLVQAFEGNILYENNLPALNGLAGLHLEFDNDTLIAVAQNDENQLILDDAGFEPLEGTAYVGVHLLDRLEVRGGANLAAIDHIRVLDSFVFDGGSLLTPQLDLPVGGILENGAATLFVDPGLRDLELDNFQLSIRTDFDLDSLRLSNGSSIDLNAPLRAAHIDVEAGSELVSRSSGNRYNPDNLYRASHGGLGGAGVDLDELDTFGSLYRPQTHGRGENAETGAGGAIALDFDTMNLNGSLNVDGNHRLAAGSILLEGNSLTGSGSITANGGGAWPTSSGGGRIALLVADVSGFSGPVTAFGGRYSNGSILNRNGGAGTVFYRTTEWPNGRLVLDNDGTQTMKGSTRLPGIGMRELGEYGELTLYEGGLPALEGLMGLYLEFDSGDLVGIAEHGEDYLVLADENFDLDTAFAYNGLHLLDRLEVRGGANLDSPDVIRVLDSIVFDDGSIDALRLDLPAETVFENGGLTFHVDPGLSDLRLENFQLTQRTVLDVTSLTLNNGSTIEQHAGLQAGSIVIDASSSIGSRSEGGRYNPDNRYRGSHGGLAGGGFDLETVEPLGSLYQPKTHGRGENSEAGAGGAVHLVFDTMSLAGSLNVDGENRRAAGSILLEGNLLTGTGSISANGEGAWPVSGGGGRIALHVSDLSGFSGAVTAFGGRYSNGSIPNHNGGAGTVFYRTDSWPNGRLVVDNNSVLTEYGSTRLPGLGQRVVTSYEGNSLFDAGLPALDGLTGLHVEFDGLGTALIESNDEGEIRLADTAFDIESDTPYIGLHLLDVLEVRRAANLNIDDKVTVLSELIVDADADLNAPQMEETEPTKRAASADSAARNAFDSDLPKDLVLEAGDTLLRGDFHFDRLSLQPGARLTVQGNLSVGQIDLWRATLIVKGSLSDPRPKLSAQGLIARESTLYVPQLEIEQTLELDSDSLLAPTQAADADAKLQLTTDHLILDGRVDLSGGVLDADFASLTADGGRVLGTLRVAGGSLEGIALSADRIVSRAPLFLSQSILAATAVEAPYLGLEHGSQWLAHNGSDQASTLTVDGGVLIDHTSAILLDGVARMGGQPVHGGVFSGNSAAGISVTQALYGSPVYPRLMGSGEAGGGALTLLCGDLIVNGRISARGQGWSAGGSILVQAKALSGSGSLDVRGGEPDGSTGGGGRIALHADATGFEGDIWTGNTAEVSGTLVMSQPHTQSLRLLGGLRGSEELFTNSSILPQLSFPASAVRNSARTADGSVWVVAYDLPFRDTEGLWLASGSKRFRVLSVTHLGDSVWRLRLRGRPPLHGQLQFVLMTDDAVDNGDGLTLEGAQQ